ncbi:TetR/AcrR family transcriptional regulator [bacterium SPL81]|nr:TetR/AcrR family transcriptional regulator [Acinetobacter baumannii]
MQKNASQDMKVRLLQAAAKMLAEDGVKALSTRKIATATGTSTMSVYTHFGSIQNLVSEMIKFGFAQLDIALNTTVLNKDSVTYLTGLTHAYIQFSRENPHLYAVMFGCVHLGELRTQESHILKENLYTLERIVQAVEESIELKRFINNSAFLIANQWWTIVHGFVLLETAKYLLPPNDEVKVLKPLLLNFYVGLGDQKEQALNSLKVYF